MSDPKDRSRATSADWRLQFASAVALALVSACKKDAPPDEHAKMQAEPQASAMAKEVKPEANKDCCQGKNACKGQGGCAVPESHACAGQNDCKGQGGCNMHCPK